MKMKILKILTVMSFLVITVNVPHIGGQWGMHLLLFLFDWSIYTLFSIITLTILIAMIISAFKNFKAKDQSFFLLGGIVLFMPIIETYIKGFKTSNFDKDFIITSSVFITLYLITFINIKKEQLTS
jgi:hypothetical protein